MKIADAIKTNVIGGVLLFISVGILGSARINNSQAKKTVKVVEDTTIIIKKEIEDVKRAQCDNRKDIDTILVRLPQLMDAQNKMGREISEIHGMLEILISLEKNKR